MDGIKLVKNIIFTTPSDYNPSEYSENAEKRMRGDHKAHSLIFKKELQQATNTLSAGKNYLCKVFLLDNFKKNKYPISLMGIHNLLVSENALLIGHQGSLLAYDQFYEKLPENGYFNSFGETLGLEGKAQAVEPLLSCVSTSDDCTYPIIATVVNEKNLNYFNNSYILCFCNLD